MQSRKKKKIIIGIIVGFIILSIGFFISIPVLVMSPIVNMHVDFEKAWTAEEFGLESKHFFVETKDGYNISAWEVAAEDPKAVIICLSGIHNPSVTAYFGHSRLLQEHNYTTILMDMRAHGESDGNVICLGYKEYLDVKAIVDYIKADVAYKDVPVVVFGLSMGGATAINAIGKIPEIDGLISLSAYSSWEDVFYEQMAMQAPVFIAKMAKPFVTLYTFLKYRVNVWSIKPYRQIENLGDRPALLMHAKDDSQVPFANLERLISHAPPHVETFVREGDLHFITEHFLEPENDEEYISSILDFLERHFSD